jgi:preprotein translocase subunit SecG
MFIIFSVFYILIAAAMIVLILLQRGAGADAGSGFGGGASSTVFGARGSASFMTRATGVLASCLASAWVSTSAAAPPRIRRPTSA